MRAAAIVKMSGNEYHSSAFESIDAGGTEGLTR